MGNSKSGISRRAAFTAIVVTAFLQIAGHRAAAQPDPLPSWNDGAVKKSITDFVARVTTQGGADFVPVEQRIATFDNDGTLWREQPMTRSSIRLTPYALMAGCRKSHSL